MSKIQQTTVLALLAATASLVCGTALAGDGAQTCPQVSGIQRRIVEHADEGMDSLRGYVWGTQITYGIGMNEVRTHLDDWRGAVECRKELARAEAKIDVAIKLDAKAR
jgi:hypothetical protein